MHWQVLYSEKLLREKKFANFADQRPFAKGFSTKRGVPLFLLWRHILYYTILHVDHVDRFWVCLTQYPLAVMATPRNSLICKSFLPRKFPAVRYVHEYMQFHCVHFKVAGRILQI